MAGNIDFELTKPVSVAKEVKDNTAAEVKDLKKILLAENSAIEVYKQVLRKFPDYEGNNDLKNILIGHKKAAEFWKIQLRSKDIHIKESSGPWGNVVATFSETAKLNSEGKTLSALKEGEAHGLSEYEGLLHNNKINFQSNSFIRNICLDQQRKHMAMLDGLMGLT